MNQKVANDQTIQFGFFTSNITGDHDFRIKLESQLTEIVQSPVQFVSRIFQEEEAGHSVS